MQKAKEYDWKDSNLAMFGSDTDKRVKKESAQTEPAWQKVDPGTEGLIVWRIVKFKVTAWPKEQYGEFYNGDSYIVLNKYKEDDVMKMDVHFWIGKYSTQDEYGTAAYKTVELDTLLDDVPVQHREVQDNESAKFLSYFPKYTLLKGGADSGFRRVMPDNHPTRLFHVKGTTAKNITVRQVRLVTGSVNNDDSFILDTGKKIMVFNGDNCDKDERFKALQYVEQLKSDRAGKSSVEHVDMDEILSHLDKGEPKAAAKKIVSEKRLFSLSDASGRMDFSQVTPVSRSKLNSDDVFMLETNDHLFVWIGRGASIDERRNALSYGCNHLGKTENPLRPVTVVAEGQETPEFNKAF